jgi:asparagine synthase (glutamine-hydrolysing)
MAHALEVRVPFLDYRLVEFVLGIRDEIKFPHTPKKLLADSFEGFLPAEIFTRKKMGFVMPWSHWMKNELRTFCYSSLERFGKRAEIHPSGLMELWSKFEKGSPEVSWSRIWPIIVLENWIEQNDIDW